MNQSHWRSWSLLILLALLVTAAWSIVGDTDSQASNGSVALQRVVSGLAQPVGIVPIPGREDTFFVVEKVGALRLLQDGALRSEPVLDLRNSVSTGSEQGLLSVALHPEFATNGRIFVNYTDRRGDTQIVSYEIDLASMRARAESRRLLLSIDQPASNHNGGMMLFGPDGYLYIATGDGGRAGDPWDNAQNKGTLLGKLLRIDVDAGDPYAVPPANPFVSEAGARPEIWAWGLRNPWRFSFDRETGDLYIADVGQNRWEEVNRLKAGAPGGANFGWNEMEAAECYPAGGSCDSSRYILPVHAYPHDSTGGCSITGGYVYRGQSLPDLVGWYVFGDYCSGKVWALDAQSIDAGTGVQVVELLQTSAQISSFGEGLDGELYLVDLRGSIEKLISP